MIDELAFGLFFLASGGLAFVLGALKLRQSVQIWRSDPVSVREAARASGPAEFEGTVRPIDEYSFDEPFSGEETVLESYTVERRKQRRATDSVSSTGGSRRNGSKWITVTSGTIRRPFLVEDETGCVAVDPEGASVAPATSTKHTASTALADDVRLRLSVLTDEFDMGSILPQLNDRKRRFTVRPITAGEDVHVYGTQRRERTPDRTGVDAVVEAADSQCSITAGDEGRAVRRGTAIGALFVAVGAAFVALGAWIALTFSSVLGAVF
ncbi:hypothetical protein [Halococcoides cellulosivorans]|uniref:RING-type E3 ubiquitin transferase n=1 Tax=Halococcoides cellulosivorans TaxID=1679096 RepID=A0A2R4X3B7_9EURY|nr:hypothetical protein [Halococcoides cellulosivorans]AWB28290.1 hypothetical protein HARCEL1_11530 [Halococcoides cellulosivorans]